MSITEIPVRRFSVVSSNSFEEVLESLTKVIGRPQIQAFRSALSAAKTLNEMEGVVEQAIGPSGLMEFIRFDIGEVLRKEQGDHAPKVIRLVVGNPLILKEMAKTVPDSASYAPVTILLDEREDGVHLSYDLMASYLANGGNGRAMSTAKDLDTKVISLIETAAGKTKHA